LVALVRRALLVQIMVALEVIQLLRQALKQYLPLLAMVAAVEYLMAMEALVVLAVAAL
jgi:hypothetical protein